MAVHLRCSPCVCLPCPVAFYPEQVRAAFVRCFASLFYTYRRFLAPATGDGKKAGKLYKFNMEAFLKSMPHECADYVRTLEQTQGEYKNLVSFATDVDTDRCNIGFSEFIHERETKKATDPSLMLFDQIILSKKNRGKASFFSSKPSEYHCRFLRVPRLTSLSSYKLPVRYIRTYMAHKFRHLACP